MGLGAGDWTLVPVMALAGAGEGAVLGTAQWAVLRAQLPGTRRWVAGNAVAWLAGLAACIAVRSPLRSEDTGDLAAAAAGLLAAARAVGPSARRGTRPA